MESTWCPSVHFSIAQAAELLSQLNIDPGMVLDLSTEDELGNPWEFSKNHMKEKAGRKLRVQEPDLLERH